MWILTAPVPNSTILKALILHALEAEMVVLSENEKDTISKKLGEYYSDVDAIKNQTIFYCPDFSFQDDDGETITVDIKLQFVDRGYEPTAYNEIYGRNAAQKALAAAGVFKKFTFSIASAPTPQPILYASKPKAKPTAALTPLVTEQIEAMRPKQQMFAKPKDGVQTSEGDANKINGNTSPTKSIDIPKPRTTSPRFAKDQLMFRPIAVSRADSLDFIEEFDVDGKPVESGRMTSTSSVSTKTPGVGDEEETAHAAESLQFTMTW